VAATVYSQSDPEVFIGDCTSVWEGLLQIRIEDKHAILINNRIVAQYYFDPKAEGISEGCIQLDEKTVNALDKDSCTKPIVSFKDGQGEEWLIAYEGGPSPRMDTLVVINKKSNQGVMIPSFEWRNGDYYRIMHICVPGRDALYTQVYKNKYSVEIRNKFASVGSTYKEVKQEYYYVGRESKVNSVVSLYLHDMKTKIATINEGARVLVLGWELDRAILKTRYGLIGWANLETIQSEYAPDGLGKHKANIDVFDYEE